MKTNTKFNIILDNRQKESIINRKNGIYIIYDNLFLNAGDIGVSKKYSKNKIYKLTKNIYDHKYLPKNQIKYPQDQFIFNLIKILEDLHENNECTFFKLYFLVKPDFNKGHISDIELMNEHFDEYSISFLNHTLVKIYKNTGLLTVISVSVYNSFYEIKKLKKKSLNIKKYLSINIKNINDNVHKDLNNTILNYTNKFDTNSEILLAIHADFDKLKHKKI